MELLMIEGGAPLLGALVALPALAALALWFFPALRTRGQQVAIWVSLIELVLVVYLAAEFDWTQPATYQFAESYDWIPALGVTWSLAVNALSLVMIILSAVLVPLVLLSARSVDPADTAAARREGGYAALVLALQAFIMIIFAAFDVVVFYLAFEAMLIPLYFMIGRYGTGKRPRQAAMKFLIYSLVGGLAMLGGLVSIYALSAQVGGVPAMFRYDTLAALLPAAPIGWQMAVFVTFVIAFAIKAPLVPLHTWLPDTAAAARPGTSVLLVGILDKIGTYGMIVLCLTFVPAASYAARWTLLILAVISIIWAGFAANGQSNLLRLVSFTSISHFGFIVMGIFIGSEVALTGAMVFMVAHGLSVAGMFLVSGWLIERGGTAKIADYGGMQRITPVLAGLWLFTGLATISLPGLSGFVPEYLVLMGTYKVNPALAIVAVFGVVLAAMYVLMPYQRIFTGPKNPALEGAPDLDLRQKLVMAPLVVGMVALGIGAAPLVSAMSEVSQQVIATVDTGVAAAEADAALNTVVEAPTADIDEGN